MLVFRKKDLAGKGMIAGFTIRCISPETQVLWHLGYDHPQEQLRDLELLYERLGVKHIYEYALFYKKVSRAVQNTLSPQAVCTGRHVAKAIFVFLRVGAIHPAVDTGWEAKILHFCPESNIFL